MPSTVVITGASSGIGRALALAYAAPGVVLHLLGRNSERLEATAAAVTRAGGTARTHVADVLDAARMTETLSAIDTASPIDLLIANAGISAGTKGGAESPEQIRAVFAVNLDGVLNTVLPILPAMRARRTGQVAIVSSIAGFRGIAGAPAYCASKAAVRVWSEGLRAEAAADGVAVNVICPGFVETPMTGANGFPMPFLIDTARAARTIRRGLARNRGRITFPWQMAIVGWLLRALPDGLLTRALARMPRKPPKA
jgi:short-subunit dehydrogenase